jgi:hypothetical protein
MKKLIHSLCVLSAAATLGQAETIYGLTDMNQLFTFDSATPGTVSPLINVTGLQVNEQLLGIDFRPRTGELYGVGDTSRLYKINASTGVATAVGGVFSTLLSGTVFGIDFNPVPDRLRIHSDSNQNLRINPITGAVAAVDADLAYAAGDPNFGQDPNVVATAYTNNQAFANSTMLYSLDSQWDILNLHSGAPGFAMLNTQASVPFLNTNRVGFDISGVTGMGYISVSPNAFTNFYTIDVKTGMTNFVGQIGTGLTVMNITAAPTPEPGTMALAGAALAGAIAYARRRRTA